MDYQQICKAKNLGHVVFSGNWNFTTANLICQQVRGKAVTIENQNENEKILQLLAKSKICPKTGKSLNFLRMITRS